MRNRWSASCGVSTPVGSSRIRMSAPRNSALRISTRCCSPTGSSLDQRVEIDLQPVVALERLELRRAPWRCRRRSVQPPSAPSITFSSTVNGSTSMKCWWTMPMPARDRVLRAADRALAGRRPGSRRRRPGRSRRGSTSASTCRRRSRRRCRGSCRPATPRSMSLVGVDRRRSACRCRAARSPAGRCGRRRLRARVAVAAMRSRASTAGVAAM